VLPPLQTPAVQVAPAAHLLTQVPQLAGSVCVFTQLPLQNWSPAVAQEQTPLAQVCPPLQATPH
jgi:hypothetical protein